MFFACRSGACRSVSGSFCFSTPCLIPIESRRKAIVPFPRITRILRYSATPSLDECILGTIASRGPISFPDFLNLALYHPTLGYYSGDTSRVGKTGDFFTSVSVGASVRAVARAAISPLVGETNGRPSAWRVLEIGAHDGESRRGRILATLQAYHRGRGPRWNTLSPSHSRVCRQAQAERLSSFSAKLNHAETLAELAAAPLPGIAFGNEILDALPFHLVRFTAGNWQELHVSDEAPGCPGFIASDPTPQLSEKLALLGNSFPENYQTEIRTCLPCISKIRERMPG